MLLVSLGLGIGLILPVIFWYNRNDSWASLKKRNYLTIPLMALGISLLVYVEYAKVEVLNTETKIFAVGLIYPQIISIIEFFFKRLSFQINGRDFYLWLQRSQEVENGMVEFTLLDKFLSMCLIIGKSLFLYGIIYFTEK